MGVIGERGKEGMVWDGIMRSLKMDGKLFVYGWYGDN